jgi:hypothetical protein
VASAYLGHGSLSTARPEFSVVSRTVSAEFLRDVFFRPWRDSFRFLPWFPSGESLGFYLSPSGLSWSGAEKFCGIFWFLHNIQASTNVYKIDTTARGGGRDDSRGQGSCSSAWTREAPIFLPRRAAMISPQRHRDRRDNSQLISGDGRAPAPCPPCLGDEDLCETNPIWPGLGGARAPAGERCETNPIPGRARWDGASGTRGDGPASPVAGADCAKRTQFLDCGLRIADCGLGTDLRQDTCTAAYRLGPAPASCTNKPNWLEPIVRNEPNLVGSNVQNEANCRAVGREPRRLLCKTKPICRGHPGMGTGGWGREGPRGRLCKTKPNLGRLGHLGDRASERGQWCKMNPISAQASRRGRPTVRNEPNSRRRRVGRDQGGERPGLSCETNPISGLPAGWGRPSAPNKANWAGPIMQNEPNSRRGRVGGGLGDEGRLRKTKPICRGAAFPRSCLTIAIDSGT